MHRTAVITVILAALASTASAQTVATAPATPGRAPGDAPASLRLTLDEAVKMALDRNVDLQADRLDPQIADSRIAAAAGAFRPAVNSSVQRTDQLTPPSGVLFPVATRNDAITSSTGVGQRLERFGTTYSLAWTATHTASNSILNGYNPQIQSGLLFNLSQPLLRDMSIDSARLQLATSRIDRDIAGTRLHESVVHTTANVKSAYWNLVSARATVDARATAVELAQELARVNRARVEVGQSPVLDLVSAEAEVASNQEQLIVAETAVRLAEDRLRVLIYDPTDRSIWNATLEPIDSPPLATVTLDLERAVTTALESREDLARAKKNIDSAAVITRFASAQRLPDVRFNLSYQASGLGGTQVIRSGAFPGSVTGAGAITDFGSVLSQMFGRNYPTWSGGISVSYPVGRSAEDAGYARAKLEQAQTAKRLKSAQGRAIQQVRDAGWRVEMNAQRIQTTRLARDLAEQRLDVERKRLDVGMSTSFLVIQAQRDLSQAKVNELGAVLAYDLALVNFEALQEAEPAGAAPMILHSGE